MKTRIQLFILSLVFLVAAVGAHAQSIQVSPELKELIELSVKKDYKISDKEIDRQLAETQRNAVRSAYIPKLELGGKYLYASTSIDSKFGDITGFESIAQLQELMANPAFPLMFPNLAGLSNEITQLQQLMASQGMSLPSFSKDLDGNIKGNYFGLDATATMLLFSGGQVPNVSKALSQKIMVQQAMSDKCEADVMSEVITYYDQLALLIQSKQVLDESAVRLAAEKKYAMSALNNGFATSFDTLKIAVAEANLEARVAEYESKKVLLNQKLEQLTGKPASSFESLKPDLQVLVRVQSGSDISKRPELRALSAGVEAQKYMLKSEKSFYLPKVQALASARYDHIFNADADFNSPIAMGIKIDNMNMGPTFLAGVGFKWELFDRSGGSSRIRQAGLEVKKAENAREEARELLQLNQTKVTTNYQAAIAQVAYKAKQRQAARLALDLAQKSYNEGMINITERLAAESEMQNAELEYLQAIFAQRQSAIECYKATGDLVLSNIR